jgi:hypothetical protein
MGGPPVRGPKPPPPPPREVSGSQQRLEWGQPGDAVPLPPALWRDPVRAAIGIACLVVLVAVIQPTATGSTPSDGPTSADALSGVNDGTLLFFVCVGVAIVTFWRPVAESDHLVPSLLPLVLGIAAALEYGLIVQHANFAIDDWMRRGGSGSLTTWVYVLGAAVAVILAGGAILTFRTLAAARRRAGRSA